jgi:UDP-MurNAc hydroxylase
MKIEWVNHASFVLEHDNIRMISDPWMEGNIFDNGWSLISKTQFTYEDFKNITHIWFSHEHPDHFYPPNLKNIPLKYRNNITILFQHTEDQKVVNYCKNVLQFKEVIELYPKKWVKLTDDFELICEPFNYDSWIYIKTKDFKILNVNDCVINKNKKSAHEIKEKVGHVDLLLTQFSFSSWPGNKDDMESIRRSASEKLSQLKMQIELFKPSYLIPFASYVWFSHEENYYMNEGINKIEDVHYFLEHLGVTSIVLYPGDVWETGSLYNSHTAIEKYKPDYDKISHNPELTKTQTVDLVELERNTTKYVQELKEKNSSSILKLLPPCNIYLTDYQQSVQLSLDKGLQEIDVAYDDCDIALSSDAFNFSMRFLYGGDTLNINGRFQIPPHGKYKNFRVYASLAAHNNAGQSVDVPFLIGKIVKKVRSSIDNKK